LFVYNCYTYYSTNEFAIENGQKKVKSLHYTSSRNIGNQNTPHSQRLAVSIEGFCRENDLKSEVEPLHDINSSTTYNTLNKAHATNRKIASAYNYLRIGMKYSSSFFVLSNPVTSTTDHLVHKRLTQLI